ncbi:NAD(P)H-dependent oxidoreductase [Promicromonospora sp. NPDC060204]|uniref:NAD(P)H-dependent oxidoreductase n=1 Tax=Promicromonospora sp. NPDC060204 TaxID=3347071 RepID=UPI0036649ADC
MPEPTPLRVVVVNGSPSEQSRTAALADVAVRTLERTMPVEVHRVDVYRLGAGFTTAVDRESVTPEVDAELRTAETADLLVAATPVFRGSYTGLFKHFFDLVEQYALANRPVLLLATGGSHHHALVVDHALRPLFAFFQARTLPVSVYASSSDFDGTALLNPRVYSRIQTALDDVEGSLRDRIAT